MAQEAGHLSLEKILVIFVSHFLLLYFVSLALALALALPQELATTKRGGIPRLLGNRIEWFVLFLYECVAFQRTIMERTTIGVTLLTMLGWGDEFDGVWFVVPI